MKTNGFRLSWAFLRPRIVATSVALIVAVAGTVSPAAACVGDCGVDGAVTVDEVLRGVNIALGLLLVADCNIFDGNGDGEVTVDEILTAIGHALNGCSSGGEATPTASPEPTPTATQTIPPTEAATPTPEGLLFDGTISELAPHGLDDELVYEVTLDDGRVLTETDRVVRVTLDDTFEVETTRDTGVEQRIELLDDGEELSRVEVIDFDDEVRVTCQSPILILFAPLRAGEQSRSSAACEFRSLQGRFLGQFQETTVVTPLEIVEEVVVPAGTYNNAIRIRFDTTIGSTTETQEILILPGVGILRNEFSTDGEVTKTRELVDGTVGGVPVRR